MGKFNLITELARSVAIAAHNNQKRKYTGEPYVTHPIAVARIVSEVTDDSEVIAAALLHDVVEDTETTIDEIRGIFGDRVANLVLEVTDVSKPEDGNRAARKAIDLAHLAEASAEGQTIKLADLIHNTESIVERDPGFARVYMKEKQDLLQVLTKGDPQLFYLAAIQIQNYYRGKDERK